MNSIRSLASSTFYKTYGSTNHPYIVFLHGFLEDHSIWHSLIERLKSEYFCINIDLPGHGNAKDDTVATIEEMVKNVLTILKTCNVSNAHFIGHSMGGYVLLAILESQSDLVKSAVLLNSTSYPDSMERKNDRDRVISLVEKNKNAFVHMAIMNLFTEQNRSYYKKEINLLIKNAVKTPSSSIIKSLEAMKVRKDRSKVFQNFNGQKAIFSGENDTIIKNTDSKVEALQTGSIFKTFAGGHMTFLEDTDNLIIELNKIFNKI
ncbi:alpha/beta hydrolase [Aquimarina sp. ERC-38]|uniref:alpha/beta fold hydrolase n=1 Tax=Aquimarina sp. ERC-38 TaxID=2949996 RepID=UPI002246EDF1|nr:alpha/beta hydrolase [Aquimarina sp. ERC-38]UZO81796.1 alpha/beta hydrolase [Aquimarina sp. ERC-38]